MTHYLRSKEGDTVVDIEVTTDDLHCVIDIKEYTKLLFENENRKEEVVDDFWELQEMRGSYFELLLCDIMSPDEHAKQLCKAVAKKYDLFYVTD